MNLQTFEDAFPLVTSIVTYHDMNRTNFLHNDGWSEFIRVHVLAEFEMRGRTVWRESDVERSL
jgi:hypothetical protein